jgi:4-amino-4-deoxy-L-arabinose transferase-like glycosyltransferase
LKLSKNYQVLVAFCVLSVLIRFLSFFPSVINHDESTYLVIARELLHGEILYVDTIDNKPIGIFLIMALIQLVAGNSVFLVRLFTSMVIAFTAYLIFKVKLNNGSDRKSAMAGGFIYIFMLSVFTFYGISVNTETYFNLFTIAGLFFLLKKNNPVNFFVAGFLLGVGFIIKYVVLFDLMAFILFYFIINLVKVRSLVLKSYLIVAVIVTGFIIPFGILNMYYYLIGHYDDLLFHTFEVSTNYPVQRDFTGIIKYISDFHLRFLPVIFFFYYCLFDRSNYANASFDRSLKTKNIRAEKLLVIIWVIFDLCAILYPGKYFGHYFIQLILPVSLFAGNFFDPARKIPSFLKKIISKPAGYIFLVIIVIIILFNQKKDYLDKPDYPREISEFLDQRLNENDVIYTGNYHHVIYFLLDKRSPAKYVHRSLIREPNHVEALSIDTIAELERIIVADPEYIICEGTDRFNSLHDLINKHYALVKTFEKDIYIYEKVD